MVKSGIYLTPNQLKLIKSFHRFLFSNVLRMEGCGSVALPYLYQTGDKKTSQNHHGCYITILNSIETDKMSYEFNWNLMKEIENCTEKSFLRVPAYIHKADEKDVDTDASREVFKFDQAMYNDSVVIPFYRNNDMLPQFYCVSSIDFTMTPLSPFPVSNVKVFTSSFKNIAQLCLKFI